MKQTKIVCSISDFRCDVDFLRKLFFSGMNVVRINTAHAPEEGIRKIVKNTRAVSPHIALLIDTKGPEIRTTSVGEPIKYKMGDIVKVFGRPDVESTHDIVNLSYKNIASDVKEGDHLLFDDGAIDMEIIESAGPMLVAKVTNDGELGSRKSVNVPGAHIDLPALTEKDITNIKLAIDLDVDFIAHSFVRSAADVKVVQDLLDEHNSDIKIISKIENQEGVDNIDEIIDASYGIMIARGDLGIEVPIEQIPGIQRNIIRKCIAKRKPVIVATQMLHTMINNPRPTRAEVTDIANAIYSYTDALMLSGETASGKYPIEACRTMATIAERAEKDAHREGFLDIPLNDDMGQREFLAKSAIEATEHLGVKGIITDSDTGKTARNLAAFRGPNPVLAICYHEKLQRWLNLSYGLIPVAYQQEKKAKHDKIAYISGEMGKGGVTTFLEINTVSAVVEESYNSHLSDRKKL